MAEEWSRRLAQKTVAAAEGALRTPAAGLMPYQLAVVVVVVVVGPQEDQPVVSVVAKLWHIRPAAGV